MIVGDRIEDGRSNSATRIGASAVGSARQINQRAPSSYEHSDGSGTPSFGAEAEVEQQKSLGRTPSVSSGQCRAPTIHRAVQNTTNKGLIRRTNH